MSFRPLEVQTDGHHSKNLGSCTFSQRDGHPCAQEIPAKADDFSCRAPLVERPPRESNRDGRRSKLFCHTGITKRRSGPGHLKTQR
jgi:hypothetical protein